MGADLSHFRSEGFDRWMNHCSAVDPLVLDSPTHRPATASDTTRTRPKNSVTQTNAPSIESNALSQLDLRPITS